ncbi:MAG: DUF4416 family protein [Leptospiraceae bacterium]|nr:DUF4416 family protein [Leptospiraceae bacterium]
MLRWLFSHTIQPRARWYVLLFFDDPAVYLQSLRRLEKKIGRIDYESRSLINGRDLDFGKLSTKRVLKIISFQKSFETRHLLDFARRIAQHRPGTDGEAAIELEGGYVNAWQVVGLRREPAPENIYIDEGHYASVLLTFDPLGARQMKSTPPFFLQKPVLTALGDLRTIMQNER